MVKNFIFLNYKIKFLKEVAKLLKNVDSKIEQEIYIDKIAKEHDVPVIFFSFDTNTSKVGMKTRIEAFVDMLEMRKYNE